MGGWCWTFICARLTDRVRMMSNTQTKMLGRVPDHYTLFLLFWSYKRLYMEIENNRYDEVVAARIEKYNIQLLISILFFKRLEPPDGDYIHENCATSSPAICLHNICVIDKWKPAVEEQSSPTFSDYSIEKCQQKKKKRKENLLRCIYAVKNREQREQIKKDFSIIITVAYTGWWLAPVLL